MTSQSDERRARALRLCVAGLSYAEIAEQEDTGAGQRRRSAKAVAADVQSALKLIEELAAGTSRLSLVTLETQRLDAAQRAVETVLRTAQRGRCGACGRGPEPGVVLRASDRLLRIMERRSMLLGLDTRERVPEAPDDELEQRRKRLRNQVGR